MAQIPGWKPLGARALGRAPYTASMTDIAPKLTAPTLAKPTWAQYRGELGLGLAKLFGDVRDAFTNFFGRPRGPQLAFAGIAGSGMATLSDDYARPSIMHMETREFAQGRKAAHASRINYETMPLHKLAQLVERREADIKADFLEWADEIITHLGRDLWEEHEMQPNSRHATDSDFWADLVHRVGNVFQFTAERTDWQSRVADTMVHEETQRRVGVSTTQFEKVVAKRLPNGKAYVALAQLHDEMSDLYHDTLLPEIEERKLMALEAAEERGDPGDPQPLDFG